MKTEKEMSEQELRQYILNAICRLAIMRNNETGAAGNHDRLEAFSAESEYGIGSARFEFRYNPDFRG